MKQDIDRNEVVRLYVEDNKSAKEISKIVSLSPGAIFSILKVRGVKTRSLKESLSVKYPGGRNGDKAANWRGGKRWLGTKKSYIGVYAPVHPFKNGDNYVMEHRLVMEKKLGRYLNPKEIVHHLNGDKKDNRIENLELVSSRGEHTRQHFQDSFEAKSLKRENERLRKLLKENGIDPGS